jgi:hypothetical protein
MADDHHPAAAGVKEVPKQVEELILRDRSMLIGHRDTSQGA